MYSVRGSGQAVAMVRRAGLCSIILMLTGCVSYVWVKPGADARERDRQMLDCEVVALKEFPPRPYMVGRHSETETTKAQRCSGDRKNNCEVAEYTEDRRIDDVNESARNTLIKDCMYQHGWSQMEVAR